MLSAGIITFVMLSAARLLIVLAHYGDINTVIVTAFKMRGPHRAGAGKPPTVTSVLGVRPAAMSTILHTQMLFTRYFLAAVHKTYGLISGRAQRTTKGVGTLVPAGYTVIVAPMLATLFIKMRANAMVKQFAEYQKTETMLRDENRAETVATIKDAPGAQAALTDSIAELKDFHKESGMTPKEPWEFKQTSSRYVELTEAPATWDSSYTGTSDPKCGSDGTLTFFNETMLEFSKMEADAKVTDASDQKKRTERDAKQLKEA